MKLADLTDAHVRALLDPKLCEDDDFQDAEGAGLLASFVDDGSGTQSLITLRGDTLLTEAQRIADGLSDDEAETLSLAGSGSREILFVMQSEKWGAQMTSIVNRLRSLGLMDDCPLSERPRQTPAGRLVLALHERRKETP